MSRIPVGYTVGITGASYAMVRLLDIFFGRPNPLPWGFYFVLLVATVAYAIWWAERAARA